MTDKMKHDQTLPGPKTRVPRNAAASPYRSLLIAASLGVIIGLLLKR